MGRSVNEFESGRKVFYHGTTQEFKPGDIITSPSERGLENPRSDNPDYKSNRVYVTPFPHVAIIYSWKPEDTKETGPTGNVYEVEPIGRLLDDKEATKRHRVSGIALHARQARVIRKVNININNGAIS